MKLKILGPYVVNFLVGLGSALATAAITYTTSFFGLHP